VPDDELAVAVTPVPTPLAGSGPAAPRADLADLTSGAMAALLDVVRGVQQAQLAAPTPCDGYDVRSVLNHVMGVFTIAEAAGRKASQVSWSTFTVDRMSDGWKATFTALAEATLQAWTAPPAWQGSTALLGQSCPAATAGRRLLGELVVHGWDLARATGQPFWPDGHAVREVHGYLRDTLATERSPTAWGPPVFVPASAPPLDRLLGLSGRHPDWPSAT
jgi:uncharacterized protein (TIGR03086 family)